MKHPLLVSCAALLVVGACSPPEQAGQSSLGYADVAEVRRSEPGAPPPAADASASLLAPREAAAQAPARPIVSVPMMAYRYEYALETPAEALRGLIRKHEAACIAAGPASCQMVGQTVHGEGRDQVVGELSLRAAPDWLRRFREGLDSQAREAGGRVVSSSTQSEDLTRQIVDTEAAIRAKSTLRDRLQAVLASRPGKLSELLEVERELARVQEEIDATQSALAVMRTRVATSALTIRYRSTGVIAAEGALAPLRDAVSDIVPMLIGFLAVMIRVLTLLLPLVLIVGAAVWLLRKRIPWPRPKAKPKPAAKPIDLEGKG